MTKPHVDHAARASWLAAVHEAMRSVDGAVVTAAEEPAVGRNYYRVGVETRNGVAGAIVFNAAALLIAAADAADPQEIAMPFVAVPGSEVYSGRGLHVASRGHHQFDVRRVGKPFRGRADARSRADLGPPWNIAVASRWVVG